MQNLYILDCPNSIQIKYSNTYTWIWLSKQNLFSILYFKNFTLYTCSRTLLIPSLTSHSHWILLIQFLMNSFVWFKCVLFSELWKPKLRYHVVTTGNFARSESVAKPTKTVQNTWLFWKHDKLERRQKNISLLITTIHQIQEYTEHKWIKYIR